VSWSAVFAVTTAVGMVCVAVLFAAVNAVYGTLAAHQEHLRLLGDEIAILKHRIASLEGPQELADAPWNKQP
jgi:hypothetical protein